MYVIVIGRNESGVVEFQTIRENVVIPIPDNSLIATICSSLLLFAIVSSIILKIVEI